jgi:5'-methylthioadenosine phosphorylase
MQRAMDGGLYLRDAAQELGIHVREGAVYVGMDGPRYETAAEITMLKRAGGDVVGMTASSEAIALAENGVLYGCLSVVTNLGAGLTKGILTHGEVTDVMEERGQEVVDILLLGAMNAVKDYRASMT